MQRAGIEAGGGLEAWGVVNTTPGAMKMWSAMAMAVRSTPWIVHRCETALDAQDKEGANEQGEEI